MRFIDGNRWPRRSHLIMPSFPIHGTQQVDFFQFDLDTLTYGGPAGMPYQNVMMHNRRVEGLQAQEMGLFMLNAGVWRFSGLMRILGQGNVSFRLYQAGDTPNEDAVSPTLITNFGGASFGAQNMVETNIGTFSLAITGGVSLWAICSDIDTSIDMPSVRVTVV